MSKVIITAILILTIVSVVALAGVVSLGQRLEKTITVPSAQTPIGQTFFEVPTQTSMPQVAIEGCDSSCQAYVQSQIAKAVATLSAQPAKPTQTSSPVIVTHPKDKQTTYISLAGTASTISTTWVDAPGTEVYIDIENDYGKNAYITWEATMKTLSGTGGAYARLFDATNGIVVQGSEVNITSGSFAQATSGQLALWRGRNLYKVQIKSLDSNEVTFGSGRIKVVY